MFDFERLIVWQKSIRLFENILPLTKRLKSDERFNLGEQIKRASLSVSTNIAEGSGRYNSVAVPIYRDTANYSRL